MRSSCRSFSLRMALALGVVALSLTACEIAGDDEPTRPDTSHDGSDAAAHALADGGMPRGEDGGLKLPPWKGPPKPGQASDAGSSEEDAGSTDTLDASVAVVPDVTLVVPEVTVPPHQELIDEACLPLGNADALIASGFELRATPGLHHMHVRIVTGDPDAGEPSRWLLGTTTGVSNTSWFLPRHIVFQVPASAKLCVGYHVVNVADDALSVKMELGFYLGTAETNQRIAALGAMQTTDIHLPAAKATTVAFECEAAEAMEVFAVSPHTHELGRELRVTRPDVVGTPLVAEWKDLWAVAWDELSPRIELQAGQRLRVECDYVNDTEADVFFGARSAEEMCMLVTFFVPKDGTLQDVEQSQGCVVAM